METIFILLLLLLKWIAIFKEVHSHSYFLTSNRRNRLRLAHPRYLILDFFLRGNRGILQRYVLEQPTSIRRKRHPGIPRGYLLEPPADMRRNRQSASTST